MAIWGRERCSLPGAIGSLCLCTLELVPQFIWIFLTAISSSSCLFVLILTAVFLIVSWYVNIVGLVVAAVMGWKVETRWRSNKSCLAHVLSNLSECLIQSLLANVSQTVLPNQAEYGLCLLLREFSVYDRLSCRDSPVTPIVSPIICVHVQPDEMDSCLISAYQNDNLVDPSLNEWIIAWRSAWTKPENSFHHSDEKMWGQHNGTRRKQKGTPIERDFIWQGTRDEG